MLPNADVGYLIDYKRNEAMEGGENTNTEDGLNVDDKSYYQQLCFFGHGLMVKAQSVASCIRREAGDCLEALDKAMSQGASNSDVGNEKSDIDNSQDALVKSVFERLDPSLQEEHLKIFLDAFKQSFQHYKTLYNNISNLQKEYDFQSRLSNTKWINSFIPTYVSGTPFDRNSEINFITDLLKQEEIIRDPYVFDEISINDQSKDWYKENTKKNQIAHALLVGACIYIQKRITAEYKDKAPSSDLHSLLLKNLSSISSTEKYSSLAFLLESAKNDTISLSLPKNYHTQEVETFSMFEENCRNFITQLEKEKNEADFDVLNENTLLTF